MCFPSFPSCWSTKKEYLIENWWNSDNQGWDLGLRRNLFDREVEIWTRLKNKFDIVRPRNLEASGFLSCKSIYLKLNNRGPRISLPMIKLVWGGKTKESAVFSFVSYILKFKCPRQSGNKKSSFDLSSSSSSMFQEGNFEHHWFIHFDFASRVGPSFWKKNGLSWCSVNDITNWLRELLSKGGFFDKVCVMLWRCATRV